jgi:hypothetical protein
MTSVYRAYQFHNQNFSRTLLKVVLHFYYTGLAYTQPPHKRKANDILHANQE